MQSLEVFNQYRPLLFGIAYRMLGSIQDAEDMLQEAYVRWQQADNVESPRAYLAAVMTRLCIDQLRAARTQREEYVGPWLPEPLETDQAADPEAAAVLDDTLSVAFMLLLERLAPADRAVFLLHEVFDYDYGEIARIVGKSEANCRQIGHRARERITAERPRFDVAAAEVERITQQFVHTCTVGDMQGMLQLLAGDVMLQTDGGGKVTAARKPIIGAENAARFLFGVLQKAHGTLTARITRLNGQPGIVVYVDHEPVTTITLDIRAGRILALYIVANPDKLTQVPGEEGIV